MVKIHLPWLFLLLFFVILMILGISYYAGATLVGCHTMGNDGLIVCGPGWHVVDMGIIASNQCWNF